MKFDKKVTLKKNTLVGDGLGGWIEYPASDVKTFDAFITPLKSDVLIKEQILTNTTVVKLFTKKDVSVISNGVFKDVFMYVGEKKYKILQYSDFGKIKMFLLELMI